MLIAAAGLIALTATLSAAPAKAPPANQLYGLSCPSANDCVAVGINENAEDTVKGGGALIQTWNGRTWASVAPKAPKGALATDLLGVSCPTAKSCVAVGSYYTPSGSAALAETWNGASWTLARPPEPNGSVTGELLKVSCPSARYCLAVGIAGSNTAESALSDRWNGQSWTRLPVQPPASAKHDADLTGVSCGSAESCVAVGFVDADFNDGGHTGQAAATAWNGKTWTAGKVAAPGQGTASLFSTR